MDMMVGVRAVLKPAQGDPAGFRRAQDFWRKFAGFDLPVIEQDGTQQFLCVVDVDDPAERLEDPSYALRACVNGFVSAIYVTLRKLNSNVQMESSSDAMIAAKSGKGRKLAEGVPSVKYSVLRTRFGEQASQDFNHAIEEFARDVFLAEQVAIAAVNDVKKEKVRYWLKQAACDPDKLLKLFVLDRMRLFGGPLSGERWLQEAEQFGLFETCDSLYDGSFSRKEFEQLLIAAAVKGEDTFDPEKSPKYRFGLYLDALREEIPRQEMEAAGLTYIQLDVVMGFARKVCVDNGGEDESFTNGQLIAYVSSPSGIGEATIERKGEVWPEKMVLRLHLRGLESMVLSNGRVRLSASVQSSGEHLRLLHLGRGQEEGQPLSKVSPFWTDVDAETPDQILGDLREGKYRQGQATGVSEMNVRRLWKE